MDATARIGIALGLAAGLAACGDGVLRTPGRAELGGRPGLDAASDPSDGPFARTDATPDLRLTPPSATDAEMPTDAAPTPDPRLDATSRPPSPDAAPPPDPDATPASPGPDAAPPPSPDPDAGPPPPAFSTLDWTPIGTGVSYKDSLDPTADGIFIGYAGYAVTDDEARAWVTALYESALADLGVRHVYAVRGPQEVQYDSREISNTLMTRSFIPLLAGNDTPILVAAHSSGAYVACELLQLLYEGDRDPDGATRGRIVYYNLDGVAGCLGDAEVGALRSLYFINAMRDGGESLQAESMIAGASQFADSSTLLTYDATETGCNADAPYCLHISLINTRPHDPSTAIRDADYSDFDGRPVNRWYLDVTGAGRGI